MPLGLDRELVLIAEDDLANQALLARLLERAGYRSFAVGDGREALHAAMEEHPDLILLDIGLPAMNGLDVCRRLRADPRTVALPIILVTGQTESRDVVAGLDAGADDFVRKPYDEAELMARVRSVLRLARVTAEMVGAHGVIAALANAVEAKDATTELHCQRLAGFAHQLGMRAGLEPQDLKGLVFGALLHDIGKIGVSDTILTKAGPLTALEWDAMRQHPIIGERIAEPLASASSSMRTTRSSTTGRTARRAPSARRSRRSGASPVFSSTPSSRACSSRSSSATGRKGGSPGSVPWRRCVRRSER